ncbi:hypothetical protein [Devosia sp. SD17-2]|uniref:hypothetical protein n=1 Tax=Devosia sp. SD17-2 TaxID=2976459 RepID=UPI0023D87656|nr:hypothetical protein [Devosia sp. SD17-2]WEJ31698.1 hypothetical protein NYQ88_12365 [Devosia sp. SD17-2]
MSPPEEPRVREGTTERNPLLDPVVLLPAAFETRDVNAALLALSEALVARTTELAWPILSHRIGALEMKGVGGER